MYEKGKIRIHIYKKEEVKENLIKNILVFISFVSLIIKYKFHFLFEALNGSI